MAIPGHNDKVPKYWALAQWVRSQIQNGELKPGDQLPSRAELRAAHGLSPGTTEKAFTELEREGLIVRQQGRGLFVAQRRDSPKSSGLIGFVGRHFSHRTKTFPETYFADSIEAAIAEAKKRLVILDEGEPTGWDQIEGAIFALAGDVDAKVLCRPLSMPSVCLLNRSSQMPNVVADEFGGARQAVEYLHSLGHRHIACLFERDPDPVTQFRFDGYCAGLRNAGIEMQPGWIYPPRVLMSPTLGYRGWGEANMNEWLQAGWRKLGCTALLVQNDLAAIGAIQALMVAGVEVPHDVSVVGFDSTEICDCVSPSVSSVRIPHREVAQRGVELLLQQLHPSGQQVPELTVIPTVLEPRESTGPCPQPARRPPVTARPLPLKSGVLIDDSRLMKWMEGVPI
jgi:DNA-binding LacI/PurR family transcriptional regulator